MLLPVERSLSQMKRGSCLTSTLPLAAFACVLFNCFLLEAQPVSKRTTTAPHTLEGDIPPPRFPNGAQPIVRDARMQIATVSGYRERDGLTEGTRHVTVPAGQRSTLPNMFRRLAQAAIVLAALALLAFTWHCDEAWFDRHVFLPQQFFIPASRGIVFWSRTMAAVSASLLLLLVPFLPRGAPARRLLVAVLLTLPAAEGLLRWRMDRLIRPYLLTAMDALTASHPRYGITLAASIDRVQPLSGRPIRFRTDGEGRRISDAAVDSALPSLVFIGESTVAGFGLQWEESFPALLGARLHLQVVNLASPAYRADQSWLRLNDALPSLEHPVAVVGIFMPGLIGRSFAGQRHPRARPSPSGGVEIVPPEPPTLLQQSGMYRLWRHLYWSDAEVEEALQSLAAVLRDMAALANARGAACICLVTGRTPQWMLRELFEGPALDYVVVEVLEKELLAEGHPGPAGSVRVADALEARLRTRIANQ